jgi:hypothetical protein
MKGLLISAVFFLLPAAASAQVAVPRAVIDVAQTYRGNTKCPALLISSATVASNQATQVIASTITLWNSITIQNLDSGSNVYCSDSVNVTSGTANGTLNVNTGFELAKGTPGAAASFYIGPGQLWYCVNDGAAPSVAVVCKGH